MEDQTNCAYECIKHQKGHEETDVCLLYKIITF